MLAVHYHNSDNNENDKIMFRIKGLGNKIYVVLKSRMKWIKYFSFPQVFKNFVQRQKSLIASIHTISNSKYLHYSHSYIIQPMVSAFLSLNPYLKDPYLIHPP